MRRRLALLLLVPLALGAAGCGDDDDDGGGGEAAGCHVTADEAGAAVGLTLEEAEEVIESDGGESCSWTYTNGEATATVDVTWFDGTGADAMEDAGAAWSDAEDVDVQGADEAVWSPSVGGVAARAGDDAVRVFVAGPDIILDDPMGAAVVIAEVALGG